jgi:mycofactocin precursor peptide peptidase
VGDRGVTSVEIETARDPSVLVVPLGSFEQHGPHLPLDTDTRIAVAIAAGLAEGPGVMVGPPLAYGASGEHAGFAGTLSLGTDVLADALVELVRSSRSAFAGVVFASAHGGNTAALERAAGRCRYEGDRILVWTATVPGGDAHAGRTETSLLLAIAPEAVRTELLEAGRTEPLAHLWPALRRFGVRGVSANGVLGDPRGASASEGRAVLEGLVEELRRSVEEWRHGWVSPIAATGP